MYIVSLNVNRKKIITIVNYLLWLALVDLGVNLYSGNRSKQHLYLLMYINSFYVGTMRLAGTQCSVRQSAVRVSLSSDG